MVLPRRVFTTAKERRLGWKKLSSILKIPFQSGRYSYLRGVPYAKRVPDNPSALSSCTAYVYVYSVYGIFENRRESVTKVVLTLRRVPRYFIY